MALTTLRYLQDNQDDPLNDLLGGGGEPAVPGSSPQPAQQEAPPQEPDKSQPSLEESLLSAPPPQQAPERVYDEPAPLKMRDSYAQPSAAPMGASKDPELDQAYRNAQMDALQHAKFDDSGYGVGEGLRDNAGALIASILDIGFNKGRGLGGIVGATADEVGKQEAAREVQRKNAADFALKAREKGDSALQQQRMDYLLQSLAERTNAHGQTQQRFDTTNANKLPDSAVYQAGVQKAGDTKTAQLNAAHALNDQTAGDRAAITTATTQAGLDTQHDNAPRTQQDAAALEAAKTGAGIEATNALAPQTTAIAADRAQQVGTAGVLGERAGQAANRPVPPGFEKADEATFDNINTDPSARQKMLGDTMAARQLSDASQSLAAMRQKYGPQMLPSQASGQYEALHLAVVGAANRAIADAGTLNAGERQLIEQYVPGATPNWKDLVGWLQGSDLNGQQLEGFATGLQQILNSRVASYGLRKSTGAPQPSASPGAPAVPAQSAAMPGYSTDYSDPRASLGPPQAMPPKPAGVNAAPGSGQPHEIRNKKTGRVVQTMMTPDQLSPALAGDWELVN